MTGFSFNKFKYQLQKEQKLKFRLLRREFMYIKRSIENFLKIALESNANIAKTEYRGLEMY